MEKKELRLPLGFQEPKNRIAWFFGDMRVIVDYRISTDSYLARFDRLDDGVQRNVCFDSNDVQQKPLTAHEFGWLCTLAAVAAFKDRRAVEGQQMWMQKLDLKTGEAK